MKLQREDAGKGKWSYSEETSKSAAFSTIDSTRTGLGFNPERPLKQADE
jgi:hypothetical protein